MLEKLVIYLFVILLTLTYTSYKSEPCVFQRSFVLHPQHYQMAPYRHQVDISTMLMPSTPATPAFTCREWQLRLAKLMLSGVVICPRVKVRQLIGEFCHPDTVFCSLVMFFSCLPISVGWGDNLMALLWVFHEIAFLKLRSRYSGEACDQCHACWWSGDSTSAAMVLSLLYKWINISSHSTDCFVKTDQDQQSYHWLFV